MLEQSHMFFSGNFLSFLLTWLQNVGTWHIALNSYGCSKSDMSHDKFIVAWWWPCEKFTPLTHNDLTKKTFVIKICASEKKQPNLIYTATLFVFADWLRTTTQSKGVQHLATYNKTWGPWCYILIWSSRKFVNILLTVTQILWSVDWKFSEHTVPLNMLLEVSTL